MRSRVPHIDERLCPRCRQVINWRAYVCGYCQAELTDRDALLKHRQRIARIIALSVLAVLGAVVALLIVAGVIRDLTERDQIGPLPLSKIEHDFDTNPDAALKLYEHRPVEIDAVVSSTEKDRLTLTSIGALSVQTYFKGAVPQGLEGKPIRIVCHDVERADIFFVTKPDLHGCDLSD